MKPQIIRIHPARGKSTEQTDYVHPTLDQLKQAVQARERNQAMRRAVTAILATDKP
jgi:cation transport regulator ChaC